MNSSEQPRRRVHWTLQGKGGVGKSLVSFLVAQHLARKGEAPACIDCDPVNATFAAYPAIGAEPIPLLDAEDMIDQRRFDGLMERILFGDRSLVIDTGASSFLPMASYLAANEAPTIIADHDVDMVVHTVIAGGDMLEDTLSGLNMLANAMPPSVKLIAWLNPHAGEVKADGKDFEELATYLNHKDRITGIVRLPVTNPHTTRQDLTDMFKRRLTFAEVKSDPAIPFMAKSRIEAFGREVSRQLDTVL